MMRSTKNTLSIFLLLLVGSMLASACAGAGQPAEPTVEPQAEEDIAALVSATGVIVPEQYVSMSTAAGGMVAELLVQEGDRVEAGEMLVRLSGSEKLAASLETAELEKMAAGQALDDLYENHDEALAAAQLRLAQAKIDLEDAEEDRLSMDYRRASQATIDGLKADYIMANKTVEDAEDFYEGLGALGEEDPVRAQGLSNLSNAQKARDRALANLNYAMGLPDANEVDKAEARLLAARAELEAAQTQVDRLAKGPDPDTLALAEARLRNAEAQITAVQASLADLALKAPFTGTVSNVEVRAGEWIVPGQVVIVLADLDGLQVETTDLSEIDVARIQVGDRAEVTFDALPEVVIEGRVESIADRSSQGAGVNYTVTIGMDEIPAGLRWGMTAFVDIEVE